MGAMFELRELLAEQVEPHLWLAGPVGREHPQRRAVPAATRLRQQLLREVVVHLRGVGRHVAQQQAAAADGVHLRGEVVHVAPQHLQLRLVVGPDALRRVKLRVVKLDGPARGVPAGGLTVRRPAAARVAQLVEDVAPQRVALGRHRRQELLRAPASSAKIKA